MRKLAMLLLLVLVIGCGNTIHPLCYGCMKEPSISIEEGTKIRGRRATCPNCGFEGELSRITVTMGKSYGIYMSTYDKEMWGIIP